MNNINSDQKKILRFIKFILYKYGIKKYPLHTILNKSLKYKDKYNLSDENFELFKKNYVKFLNISDNSNNYTILKQQNNITNKININDEDQPIAKQI
jgi:hypothetical protein